MPEREAMNNNSELTDQSKTISLFKFIRELNKLKQKTILNISDYKPGVFTLSDLPCDPNNITINYCDRLESEDENEHDEQEKVLLSVRKPKFQKCPEPDDSFREWLLFGWNNFQNEPGVKKVIEPKNKKEENIHSLFDYKSATSEEEALREYFEDSEKRVNDYKKWVTIRSEWAEKQKISEQTRKLFSLLYDYYFDLQREAETKEIVVANGILMDRESPEICHPVLTRRVKMEYDADNNVVSIVDTDTVSELYSAVFQVMDDVNLSGINTMLEELQRNDYHPLDRNDTPLFLKALTHQLSSDSLFLEHLASLDEKAHSRIQLCLSPCFIVRKRLDGTLKAIERIIEDVKTGSDIPNPIVDIVSGGIIDIPEDMGESTIEERLAAVGGESVDILLSKEANKEQLDIARRIERYNAVLVQGPPGTGKTHTIANLMGHFLAQGKSILVTSYTKKALSVLKDKVAPGLQNLCVSMLDDSNVDMERSVDGITSYTSRTTSFEVKREMDSFAAERKEIIKKLAEVRKKIYAIINKECNCIVLDGEDISPSKAAAFVVEHAHDLSYIPGKVRLNFAMPLTFEQLNALYKSNVEITASDEEELEAVLPNPKKITVPGDFGNAVDKFKAAIAQVNDIQIKNAWFIRSNSTERTIRFSGDFGELTMPYPPLDAIEDLKMYATSFGKIDKWMKAVAVDGKNGGARSRRWQILIDNIKHTNDCADDILTKSLGKKLFIDEAVSLDVIKSALEEMQMIFAEKGKINKLILACHKDYKQALASVTINGATPNSAEDCEFVIKSIELQKARQLCGAIWNELLTPNGTPAFEELDNAEPERIAANWIPLIEKYLNWYGSSYNPLLNKLNALGISGETVFQKSIIDSEITATDKILTSVEKTIPQICDACVAIIKSEAYNSAFNLQKAELSAGKRGNSRICKAMVAAINDMDVQKYAGVYAELEKMYEKYELQRKRNEILATLEPIAPQWAEAVRNRQGIHGACTVPSDIYDAWKWKQLSGIIEEIVKRPFEELQAESLRLSREYRDITAEYAEKCGWYHLLRRTEADITMKQNLEGWRQTVKKIGKGTGKSAPKLKAEARELMAQCQKAVPCWIMPINKALESLDPRVNRFDVIIIDEASQSDVSSLAILYMGKKLIIVGDDKQVSPMGIGTEDKKINSLQEQYISGKIPNAHLYTAKTSIYDIAKTTFQPLMLREHFRCVPEIIGFSNRLSYDGKIVPLRDASNSVLLPSIINYCVDGQRIGKTNPKEAETIVALMRACFEQPEYAGKTFGVISMLGDEQVRLIQQEIEKNIDPREIKRRSILCGKPGDFQGDERDVIFLSLVDSATGAGPLFKMEFGVDDAYRKRYNVAVSRAKDQLWVVDSLDPVNDLKPGDIRKRLIEYSIDPKREETVREEIEKKADSPFEVSVASMLTERGYHLVQQYPIGSYRLDIVAVCGKKKVAIECDGERWHSGEEKIREDMERQTILERLGWRFIRIRGSEFYSDGEKTIKRVIAELSAFGIEPEDAAETKSTERETELLRRIKTKASAILNGEADNEGTDEATIAAALDPNETVPGEKLFKAVATEVEFGYKDLQSTNATVHNASNVSTKPNLPKVTEESAKKAENKAPEGKPKATFTAEQQRKSIVGEARAIPIRNLSSAAPASAAASAKSARGDGFVRELVDFGAEFVDNRKQSNIVWVIYDKEKREKIEKVISKYNYKFTLEKRGAIATNNYPAWRVMI